MLPTPAATLEPAPLRIQNPPARLRVTVDGREVSLPLRLARKPGTYKLRFSSPGRQSQSLEVDGMAASHDIRLNMPRWQRDSEDSEIEDVAEAEPAPSPAVTPAPVAAPPPAPPAEPEKPRPTLIEDVDDAPAPRPADDKPRVPLIEDP
jgi:hypothetical protein